MVFVIVQLATLTAVAVCEIPATLSPEDMSVWHSAGVNLLIQADMTASLVPTVICWLCRAEVVAWQSCCMLTRVLSVVLVRYEMALVVLVEWFPNNPITLFTS